MPEGHERAQVEAFVDRLAAALGDQPQAVVAKRAGIPKSTMGQYLQGTEPSLFRTARLAKALNVSLLWLATGEGQPNAAASGFESVPVFDVRLAAGAASFAEGAVKLCDMPIDHDMLRRMGRIDADGLAAVDAEGDSMEPLIADGSRVVLNTRDTRLREGIFAFRMGDELRIKRLRRLADGVEILSENPRYEPERLAGHQLEHFAIIGRALLGMTIL